MPVMKVNDLCSFSQCCGCISNVPPNRTCKIKLVFGTLTCGKNTEKPFWIPLDDPFGSLERPVYGFFGHRGPTRDGNLPAWPKAIRPLTGTPAWVAYPDTLDSQPIKVEAPWPLGVYGNFRVKRHTSNGMRNKQSWYVSLWKKSGSPVEVGSLSHYSQGFLHPWWCRISSINSIMYFF